MSEIKPVPNRPHRTRDLPVEDYLSPGRFGDLTIPLSAHGGATQLGFLLVELPPGKQGCPFHYHMLEEEHFYVLEGQCVLRSGDERFVMEPGDYVCFPAGSQVAHTMLNPYPEACRMIVVGTTNRNEVAVYPDSRKALVRSLGNAIIPWPQERLDYNAGEPVDVPLGDPSAEGPTGTNSGAAAPA